jgi:membrane-associated phospholipid phosphatase
MRRLPRRVAVLAFAALAALTLPVVAVAGEPAAMEPRAGSWKTWVLASGKDAKVPSPPDGRETAAELTEVRALVAGRDAAALERVRHWDFGSPSHRWNEILTDIGVRDALGTAPGLKAFALLNVAVHDAMVAAWDAKQAHGRRRPAEVDTALATAVPVPRSPSYPCEYSVAAGAASTVLAHLFPKDAERLRAAAQEAARSRVVAGVAFPSDTRAGLDLGRAVAERVLQHTRVAGAKWSGPIPTGPGLWTSPTPGAPPPGVDDARWKTFVLTSPDQVRPGPPPAHDSPLRAAETAEVKNFKRTPLTSSRAAYWQFGQYGQAGLHYLFSQEIGKRLAEAGLDRNPPRAARAYALVHVAHHDAWVASQDAKFHYWTGRPAHFDPTITTTIPTPPFPSYPSNAAALGRAPAEVLAHLFPAEAARYRGWAREFGESRLWSGIHFKSDIDAGFDMGAAVGRLVVDRARSDGAE